jgi:hypothetical protein
MDLSPVCFLSKAIQAPCLALANTQASSPHKVFCVISNIEAKRSRYGIADAAKKEYFEKRHAEPQQDMALPDMQSAIAAGKEFSSSVVSCCYKF